MLALSPLTNCDDVTLLQVIQSERLINDWNRSFGADIKNELEGCPEIYLYRCNQTNLKFFLPSNITGSSKLYEQLQKFPWYYAEDKWEHQIALKDLSNCLRILEVGSGSGYFVKLGVSNGLNVRGIEYSKAAVESAQKQNLPVELQSLEEAADLYKESLDGVCSFQVLEHVGNPKDFINWTIQMLKPGGKLIYCVPNADSFLKHQHNLLDMPPHHMHRWSNDTFYSLETLFPIKLEKTLLEPLASYHVSSYLASYTSYFRSTYSINKLFFNRFSYPIYEKLLHFGLRKYLTGQSLYVQFRKI
jgi:2-polyprenyl-3-methyl-5-hydroxy-6-metoxy-1,4-benzoquinol methylase